MVLPLTITVVACLAVAYLVKPTVMRFADHHEAADLVTKLAILSMLAAIIVGGWSFFILCTIGLKHWVS